MKSVALFFAQVAMVIGLAVVVFAVIPGTVYLLIAGLITAVTVGLIVNADAELEMTLGYVLSLIAISVLFGAFWPALPVIAAWGRVKRQKADAASSGTQDSSSSSDASGRRAP